MAIVTVRDGWSGVAVVGGCVGVALDFLTYYVMAGNTPVLVHNTGGMDRCSDAAYQGVLHVREGAAKEAAKGGARNHHFAMNDDHLADYLDGFAGRSDGASLQRGGVGWYDAERGVTVIQRGEYSMTAFRESAEDYARRRGTRVKVECEDDQVTVVLTRSEVARLAGTLAEGVSGSSRAEFYIRVGCSLPNVEAIVTALHEVADGRSPGFEIEMAEGVESEENPRRPRRNRDGN